MWITLGLTILISQTDNCSYIKNPVGLSKHPIRLLTIPSHNNANLRIILESMGKPILMKSSWIVKLTSDIFQTLILQTCPFIVVLGLTAIGCNFKKLYCAGGLIWKSNIQLLRVCKREKQHPCVVMFHKVILLFIHLFYSITQT